MFYLKSVKNIIAYYIVQYIRYYNMTKQSTKKEETTSTGKDCKPLVNIVIVQYQNVIL